MEESNGWGSPAPPQGDVIKDALKKEQLLKDIAASQQDLRTILGRVQTVQKEVEKLTSGNETLQMYIDNLTVQMAKRR
ncbi:hypothetical protein FB45DRAFT_896739 [Roridomyces roridus]|uniref:Uncharacterized protein n=1 Tax=Roridomyces roridus TaxID=1738132 RepID=A0AAD7FUH9_9AGAR|nr:hypothetical protein FB45DRAFT_896739 [Roridomyces roridus]